MALAAFKHNKVQPLQSVVWLFFIFFYFLKCRCSETVEVSSRKRLKVGRLRFKSLTVVVPPDGGGCCRRGGCHSEAPVLDGLKFSD